MFVPPLLISVLTFGLPGLGVAPGARICGIIVLQTELGILLALLWLHVQKRMHKSRLLRKMDEDIKELMREVVYLRAVADP